MDLALVYEVPEAARRELSCGAGRESRWLNDYADRIAAQIDCNPSDPIY